MRWQFFAALVIGAGAVSSTRVTQDRAHSHAETPTRGVVAIDVFAQPTTIDLLLVEEQGQHGTQGKTFDLYHQRSADGGVSWSPRHKIDRGDRALAGAHRGMDPQIAAAGDTLVAMWTMPGTDKWGSGPLATSRSRDGGRTWTPGVNPTDDGSTEGHSFIELGTDAQSRFHAFWLDSRDGGQGLRTSVSADGGRTWSKNLTIDSRTCECCWNKTLATGPNAMFVLYRDKDPRDMAIARTDDGGRTWNRRATVGAFNWQFDGCPHVGGGLARTEADGEHYLHAMVWTGVEGREGVYVLRSGDDGRQWTAPQRLGGPSAKHADLAGARRDVIAAWDESGDGQSAVKVARSRDQGATWESVRTLAAAAQASHPLVVTSRGRFVVFWTEKTPAGALTWKSVHVDDAPDMNRTAGDLP